MNKKKYFIKFTEKAINKAFFFFKNKKNLNLRIFIQGGGCAGFKYKFIFDKIICNDDIIIKKKINFVIDFISYQYLIGSTIDYIENIEESKFIVYNPRVITTCNCGSSFSI